MKYRNTMTCCEFRCADIFKPRLGFYAILMISVTSKPPKGANVVAYSLEAKFIKCAIIKKDMM